MPQALGRILCLFQVGVKLFLGDFLQWRVSKLALSTNAYLLSQVWVNEGKGEHAEEILGCVLAS